MPKPRISAMLVPVCFLASSFNGLFPLAQATQSAPKVESQTVTRPTETVPEQYGFYDPTNPDYPKLQKASEALARFPLDKRGLVDWMKALRNGAITPRADLTGGQKMRILDRDIIMKNTREMPYVKFPHGAHTQWLDCANCHDKIFLPKAGVNPINMTKTFQGQDCGVCHDRVAFGTYFSCERCHSVPHGELKPGGEGGHRQHRLCHPA